MRFKDANECRMAGLRPEDMMQCLDEARDFAPEKVRSAAEFYDEFMAEWFERHIEEGLELPWEFPFRIRMGELTVWTGIEKSGKTTALGFVLMCLMRQGEMALVASFEVSPVKTLKKFSRQAWGGLLYEKKKIEKFGEDLAGLEAYKTESKAIAKKTFDWIAPRLWLYHHVGIGNWRELLDDMRWARRRHGITQFIVDNFMRIGIVKDDYAQQAEAITAFTALSMELGVHIHMVVHQNKSEGHKGTGGKRTVSGAFEIIANAHNIVEMQRDERKGEAVSDLWERRKLGKVNEKQFEEEKQKLDDKPDGKFILHAQRDGDPQNASKYLWFLFQAQQYCDQPKGHQKHVAIQFVPDKPSL